MSGAQGTAAQLGHEDPRKQMVMQAGQQAAQATTKMIQVFGQIPGVNQQMLQQAGQTLQQGMLMAVEALKAAGQAMQGGGAPGGMPGGGAPPPGGMPPGGAPPAGGGAAPPMPGKPG